MIIRRTSGYVIYHQCSSCSTIVRSKQQWHCYHTTKVCILYKSLNLVTALKRSCPAVSQIWSLIFFPDTSMILVPNSTPMVCGQSAVTGHKDVKKEKKMRTQVPQQMLRSGYFCCEIDTYTFARWIGAVNMIYRHPCLRLWCTWIYMNTVKKTSWTQTLWNSATD